MKTDKKTKSPSLKNLEQSAPDSFMSYVQNKFLAPKSVVKSRMSICESCDFYVEKTTFCSDCSCIMSLKTKLSTTRCPQKKWGPFRQITKEQIEAAKKEM